MNDHQRRRLIRSLEAKAASTSFPAEADALRAKAAELRAKVAGPEPDSDGALRDMLERIAAQARASAARSSAMAHAAREANEHIRIWYDEVQPRPTREQWGAATRRARASNSPTEEHLAEAARRLKAEADQRVADWNRQRVTNVNAGARFENIHFHGNVFEEMGGITVNFQTGGRNWGKTRQRVTNVNGQTYWIDVE